MELKHHVSSNGWQVAILRGRFDAHTSPEVDQFLTELMQGGARLALDLTDLEYLSSAGLRVMLLALQACQAKDGDVCLISPRANVAEVLEVSGFTSIFRIVASEGRLPG